MSLVTRITSVVQAIGADVKAVSIFRDMRDRNISQSMAMGAGQTNLTGFGAGPTGTGTATAATHSWNNVYSSFRRLDYVAASAAGAVAGIRANQTFARGVAGYASSGWSGKIVAGPAVGMTSNASLNRFFMGLRGSASAPTDINPSTMVNIVGVGWDSGDTNWQLFYNDGSGTATKVSLGVAHDTADRVNAATSTGNMYEFSSSVVAGGTSIDWSFTNLVTGTVVGSGTISSADIPVATQALTPYIYASAGGATAAAAITYSSWYFESAK